MWHEARRQERKIRGMLVDYRKRAERRRDFYERIKADPTQFLQIHGRQCRIHLDPAVAAAADSAVMMPWQGNENNLIDRFDVRAHLDYIPAVKKEEESELTSEDRQVNYERYRIVAQNNYLGISEEKFLKQLHLEEQFGYTENKSKKDSKGTGVAIGFNYEEGTAIAGPQPHDTQDEDNSDDENSDSDLDVDLSINISKIDPTQAHEMNKAGQQFGMAGNDFYSFLTNDMEEAETYKLAKEEEHEKALYSGRKSRRERRAHREKRLANRKISPPSYAAKESPTNALRDESKSPSRSPSPDDGEKITYITSFGDDEEVNNKPTYADKVKCGKFKGRSGSFDRGVFFDKKRSSTTKEVVYDRRKYSRSPKRSRSRSWSRRKRSRSGSGRGRSRRSNSRCRSISKRSRSGSVSLKTSRKSRSRSRSRTKRPRIRSCSGSSKSRSRRVRSRSRQASRDRRSSSQSSSPLSSSSSSSSSSRSRSLTRSRSKSRSKSKSKSVEPMETSSRSPVAPKPPIIRYYGRKKSDVSSSELSSADEEEEDIDLDSKADNQGSSDSNRFGNNSGSASKRPSATLSVIERLKLKRQALINRQFKKDKIAESQKIEREKQAQQLREDELREMALKLRRRQRELRHAYDRSSSSDSESSPDSNKRKDRESDSPKKNSREREPSRDKRIERTRDRETHRRSDSRDRNRRRRSRSRSKDRSRRSRSRSNRRYDGDRNRSPGKESTRKLVDY